jgi:plastocyanin
MTFLKNLTAAATTVAAALSLAACGGNSNGTPNIPMPPPADKPAENKQLTGTIRGRVQLKGDTPKPGSDPITADQKICGNEVSLPRIVVGADKGVESTFVFLEGVTGSGTAAASTKAVLIDQKSCQYVPHSLIVPLGSTVEIVNSDPILHNVHGTHDGSNVFNYAQPKQGERQSVDTKNMKPGIVTLTCEAGHPWMNAFMFVTKDPSLVALTDQSGEFVIKDVPPGTYTIKMWHEGVQLKKINKTLQTYEYEAPYEISQQVTVTANNEASVNFDLTLRK